MTAELASAGQHPAAVLRRPAVLRLRASLRIEATSVREHAQTVLILDCPLSADYWQRDWTTNPPTGCSSACSATHASVHVK
ncbi:hypothetical protein ACWDKQ_32350 [Saccharopolyspora sp. NPDC000995]